MADPRNNDRVSLWERNGKSGPYYGGEVQIDGVEYWINIFQNTDRKDGRQPAWSGNVKRKDDQAPRPAPAPRQTFAAPQDGSSQQHYDSQGRLLNKPFIAPNPATEETMKQVVCPNCNGTKYDRTGTCQLCHQTGMIWMPVNGAG